MGLREIEPGMVVHCRTEEEARTLIGWAYECGYRWAGGSPKKYTAFEFFEKRTCYEFDEAREISFTTEELLKKRKKKEAIEFSALILPDLTAKEVLDTIYEICAGHSRCDDKCSLYYACPVRALCSKEGYSPEKIIEICWKWIGAHEKKEPGKNLRIETVDVCRIIETLPDGSRRCVHEEDIEPDASFGGERLAAEEILKTYCMGHDGDFIAVHEVVSRIKKE